MQTNKDVGMTVGTTIYLKGKLNSQHVLNELLEQSIQMVKNNKWKYEEILYSKLSGIIVYPHERSEPLCLGFNEKTEIDTFIKTVYAPFEVHNMIIDLMYSIKPFFKRLEVIDDTGYWEKLNTRKKISKNLSPQDISNEEIQSKLTLIRQSKIDETEDEWFWYKDYHFSLLHLPTILNLMRLELSLDNKFALVELSRRANEVGIYPVEVAQRFPEMVLILLVRLWIQSTYEGELSDKKFLDADSFSWTIAEACFGYHGGFLNNKHRQGVKLMKEVLNSKLNAEDSIRYLLAIREFYDL